MKYTNSMKSNGELAARNLSDKAFDLYNNTDPLNIYEYHGEDDKKLYAYTGCLGEAEDLTFEELQERFESLADELNEDE